MSADCAVTQILPERDEECVRCTGSNKGCGSASSMFGGPTLSSMNVNSYLQCSNIFVAVLNEESTQYLSYERGICKWGSNFCAQVELLIINYICGKT